MVAGRVAGVLLVVGAGDLGGGLDRSDSPDTTSGGADTLLPTARNQDWSKLE